MGVYIFQSLHFPMYKIGSTAKQNPWQRIINSGYLSLIRPPELLELCMDHHLDLLAWWPNGNLQDEKTFLNMTKQWTIVGEWREKAGIEYILPFAEQKLGPSMHADATKRQALEHLARHVPKHKERYLREYPDAVMVFKNTERAKKRRAAKKINIKN